MEAGNKTKPGAKNVKEAWQGKTRFGDMQSPLKYGKIDDSKDNIIFRAADIEIILGYNLINTAQNFLGLNLRSIIPTGNKPTSKYLFEPMVGHSYWESGIGLLGKGVLWSKKIRSSPSSSMVTYHI